MYIAKVIGTVVSTRKDEGLKGLKLLVVQPLTDELTPKGKPIIAIDTLGRAGRDDIVYLAKAKESSFPLENPLVPSDAGIMGIVDDYYMKQEKE
jgi:ethanolamine utilization protein EutN